MRVCSGGVGPAGGDEVSPSPVIIFNTLKLDILHVTTYRIYNTELFNSGLVWPGVAWRRVT